MTDTTATARDALVKTMVDRFLAWPLPADFHPDGGISAARPNYGEGVEWRPVGTNLLTAAQAEAMVRHLLGDHLASDTIINASDGAGDRVTGWDHRYRPLHHGEIITATDECRRDDGNWITGICVGEPAPDPAYTSHRVYRRLRQAAGGAGEREAFLSQLRRVNTDRYHAWVGEGQDAGILFDAAELGGEVGELLNVVKKLEREERGWRGSRAAPGDFADECADVLICLDKLARRRDVDLEAATIAKFNATSEKVGLPHKLDAASRAPADPRSALEALELADAASGAGERKWPDIGEDPMKATPYDDRMAVSAAAIRKAYTVQQRIVPDQTALVWRWHLGALLEAEIRLRSILADDEPASLPPATDPAMGLELAKARKSIEILRRALAWHGDRQRMATTREHWQQEVDAAIRWVIENPEPDYPSFSTLAALATAPTIPATGEAGKDGDGWCSRCGCGNDAAGYAHLARRPTQTGKATIPATGHAATVDPDDLRPWGYAPGDYLFRCTDCPPVALTQTLESGDKRSWRCKPHAEAARDASGHAATEGEGA